jgi:serine/threonine protein phosphatase PrpC
MLWLKRAAASMPHPSGGSVADLPGTVADAADDVELLSKNDAPAGAEEAGTLNVETTYEDTADPVPGGAVPVPAADGGEAGNSEEDEDEDDIVLPTAEEPEPGFEPAADHGSVLTPDSVVQSTSVVPRLRLEWPAGFAPELVDAVADPAGLDLRRLVVEANGLWDVLCAAVTEWGPGCLAPEGVHWSRRTGWQLALTPAYDSSGTLYNRGVAGTTDGAPLVSAWRQDLQAVAVALVHAASGRRPLDLADARRLVDLGAGDLPVGLDAVVHVLLAGSGRPGDVAQLRRVHQALSCPPSPRVAARCFLETAVGSRKAHGNAHRDNEDAAHSERASNGTVRLAVFDGTTGDGSGSGYVAARAAREAAGAAWQAEVDEPAVVLAEAEAAVTAATKDGSTTAVVARVGPDGCGKIAALGDSAAWLMRRVGGGTDFVAWRLTPAHTAFAEQHRGGVTDSWGHSEITRYLGGRADDPFVGEFTVTPGDLLLLATDGATAEDRDEWFGGVLCRLARARVSAARPLAAGLAADLVTRAESLGGWDNATALVAEFTEP